MSFLHEFSPVLLEAEKETYYLKNNMPKVKHRSGNTMLWDCFSAEYSVNFIVLKNQ